MLSEIWYRLRAIFRRRSVERELDKELRFHVERITQKYVRRGHAPGEAPGWPAWRSAASSR